MKCAVHVTENENARKKVGVVADGSECESIRDNGTRAHRVRVLGSRNQSRHVGAVDIVHT